MNTPTPVPAPADTAPEILAAIAAAVALVFGPNARIAGMQPAGASAGSIVHLWAFEGRSALHLSHRPR